MIKNLKKLKFKQIKNLLPLYFIKVWDRKGNIILYKEVHAETSDDAAQILIDNYPEIWDKHVEDEYELLIKKI